MRLSFFCCLELSFVGVGLLKQSQQFFFMYRHHPKFSAKCIEKVNGWSLDGTNGYDRFTIKRSLILKWSPVYGEIIIVPNLNENQFALIGFGRREVSSVTRLGDFLHFGQLYKAFGNN